MTDADIKFEVLRIFDAPVESQLQSFQTLSANLTTDQEREYFLSAFAAFQNAPKKICLVLIHGIRTHATWQSSVKVLFEHDTNVAVVATGFGFWDVIRFLFWFRNKPVEKVAQEFRDLPSMYPDHRIVVIAHSFGTFVMSRILRYKPDIRITRLILCGSIIPEDYRWDNLRNAPAPNTVVNEVGTKDIWPVLARVGSLGYGPSGSFGFKTARVVDRFFEYGHSDFFSDHHILTYWRPFVVFGHIVKSPWDQTRPNPSWLVSVLGSLPFIKPFIMVAALLAGLYLYG